MEIEGCLKKYFGYASFRPGQKEIVSAICHGKDTISVLPTGGGKSICFQIPGLMRGGITLVITPLISLMVDQVDNLKAKGVVAMYLASSQTKEEQRAVYSAIKNESAAFLYISPERLQQKKFLWHIHTIEIKTLVIDEAHCIVEWGDSFRKDYSRISIFVNALKSRPIIAAFTATATYSTMSAISSSLNLKNPFISVLPQLKEHHDLSIIHCNSLSIQHLQLLKILKKHRSEKGIIYVSTRAFAQELIFSFRKWSFFLKEKSDFYHAGLSTVDRQNTQNDFKNNMIQILVATNAFGMGIDIPDIRFVIHYHVPGSLENFAQEIGRAGRDRLASYSYLLFNSDNTSIQTGFIAAVEDKTVQKKKLINLQEMLILTQTKHCLQWYIAYYFDKKTLLYSCRQCSNCRIKANKQSTTDPDFENRTKELLKKRKLLAQKYSLHANHILPTYTLLFVALLQPQTKDEYASIPGIGDGWLRLWYSYFSLKM